MTKGPKVPTFVPGTDASSWTTGSQCNRNRDSAGINGGQREPGPGAGLVVPLAIANDRQARAAGDKVFVLGVVVADRQCRCRGRIVNYARERIIIWPGARRAITAFY